MKKNILLIAPSTYGFYNHIICSISKLENKVAFFDEHAINKGSMHAKLFYKLSSGIIMSVHTRYIKKIINSTQLNYDIVIVIRGEYLNSRALKTLKVAFKDAVFIMYQWDFEKNLPLLKSQVSYFDAVYSFDKHDSNKFGFVHKPLFFNTLHESFSGVRKKYLFNFVGTDHSDRNKVIKDFIEANDVSIDQFFLHLFRPKKSILLNALKNPKFLFDRDLSLYKHFPLDEESTIKSMAESEIIVDITQPEQTGLTMRTLEALGLKRKLVTTNKDVVNYDFYHPNNVFLIDRNSLKVPKSFIDSEYVELHESIYNKYHVDNWVKELIVI
ncbi:hypothetical protein OTE47_001468 [Vibrio vulnificus]|nr:hypothetical protein [Vibrio vulnificus]EIZ1282036.1 hypothetical protein [Vibrio vulnificus]EKE1118226.1 hypothetical protein [Vibrio vulnificus]EME0137890.1 hypothetical protein [Vibrio vulnificus]HAS8106705.1 hypothetical protein [Vibrio vulnificus]